MLAEALQSLPQSSHPDLLVGFNTADDAGVFRISERQALVQTVDFFPPIVDDPFAFGQIAAANALSDIFAMGGRPLTALNIVGFPMELPLWVLTEILRGGAAKVAESGAVVVGGHSIKDKELKFGIAVTGIVDPAKVITNAGARPGDLLFLTKPLGTGIITTAVKRGAVTQEAADLVIASMSALNRTAAELMVQHQAHAATDITGFGLLGHAYEMAVASKASISIDSSALPLLPQALELAGMGMIPGGANDNRTYLNPHVRYEQPIEKNLEHVLFDPQTSGGLLIAIELTKAAALESALRSAGLPCKAIGSVLPLQSTHLVVH